MKKRLIEMSIYLLFIGILFYLFPLAIKDTGSAMLAMMVVLPLECFIASLIYGIKQGFNSYFALCVMIIFLPSLFIYYNESAAIYLVLYGFVALTGNGLGQIIRNAKNKSNNV